MLPSAPAREAEYPRGIVRCSQHFLKEFCDYNSACLIAGDESRDDSLVKRTMKSILVPSREVLSIRTKDVMQIFGKALEAKQPSSKRPRSRSQQVLYTAVRPAHKDGVPTKEQEHLS